MPSTSARSLDLRDAAAVLAGGGVIAYPTEAVWGLGCDPASETAVLRLLAIKRRAVAKGLILIAADAAQLAPWVDLDALSLPRREAVLASWPGPHTWVVPAAAKAPGWITGAHEGIAVRVSAHPTVIGLCRAFDAALVSTSANRAGIAPPKTIHALDPALLRALDGIVEGETGGLERPTAIRDARSGQALRS